MTSKTPEERLDHIIRMKQTGLWRHYDSVRELADAWGCPRREVERSSSEADRCIARMFPAGSAEEREAARGRLLAEVDRHIEAAATGDKPQMSAVAQLFKLKMSLSGVGAPATAVEGKSSQRGDGAEGEAAARGPRELAAELRRAAEEQDRLADEAEGGKEGMH